MTRNWSAILIDAGLRGLCQTEVAHEQGCQQGEVWAACKRYGVKLNKGKLDHDRNVPKSRATISRVRSERWARRFADSPVGMTVNEFCRKWRVSAGSARDHAKAFGYEFKPSPVNTRRAA